jgi:glycosyltransferase involved in cell wall biosynthesis
MRAIFQNVDDQNDLVREGIVRSEDARLIRGSGVDVSRFVPSEETPGDPVVILASRMLWSKGVGEFVEAARLLKKRGVRARYVLSGRVDTENPGGIPEEQLATWQAEGVVDWWAYREDMPRVFAETHIVVLPTYYGEGVPKVLIEAASSGRPIVATSERGCREIVRDGENGLLVPARDPVALADAIATLVGDPVLRSKMGTRGRQIVIDEFSMKHVNAKTLAVYQELLGDRWPASGAGQPA